MEAVYWVTVPVVEGALPLVQAALPVLFLGRRTGGKGLGRAIGRVLGLSLAGGSDAVQAGCQAANVGLDVAQGHGEERGRVLGGGLVVRTCRSVSYLRMSAREGGAVGEGLWACAGIPPGRQLSCMCVTGAHKLPFSLNQSPKGHTLYSNKTTTATAFSHHSNLSPLRAKVSGASQPDTSTMELTTMTLVCSVSVRSMDW